METRPKLLLAAVLSVVIRCGHGAYYEKLANQATPFAAGQLNRNLPQANPSALSSQVGITQFLPESIIFSSQCSRVEIRFTTLRSVECHCEFCAQNTSARMQLKNKCQRIWRTPLGAVSVLECVKRFVFCSSADSWEMHSALNLETHPEIPSRTFSSEVGSGVRWDQGSGTRL